jgi:hypothetical protein
MSTAAPPREQAPRVLEGTEVALQVPFPAGWLVVAVELFRYVTTHGLSPIARVRFRRDPSEEQQARFDVEKQMFIDRPPVTDDSSTKVLARKIAAAVL